MRATLLPQTTSPPLNLARQAMNAPCSMLQFPCSELRAPCSKLRAPSSVLRAPSFFEFQSSTCTQVLLLMWRHVASLSFRLSSHSASPLIPPPLSFRIPLIPPPSHSASLHRFICDLNMSFLPQTEINEKGGVYSDCASRDDYGEESNVFQETVSVKYSSDACFKTCYQKYVISECHCADPQYPITGQAFNGFDGGVCDINNVTQG